MKALLILSFYFSFSLFAQDKSDHRVILLNGGHDKDSNMPRYYENIKSMYEAFRGNNVRAQDISVFYGSGDVNDTFTPMPIIMPKGIVIPEFKAPEIPSIIPKRPSPFALLGNSPAEKSETPKNDQEALYSLKDLFNGEEKQIDGAAKKERLKEKFKELQGQLKPGDNLSLFITDHGDTNEEIKESTVNLWGEELTTSELREMLQTIPESVNIRIVTNICYGGGLNDLTSKNICVFANQEKGNPSYSESKDLDLYAQNFSFAMKNKLDFDDDGKVTYLDAHEYALTLENKKNIAVNSLDWFLVKTREQILALKKAQEPPQIRCETPEDESFTKLSNLMQDFSRLQASMAIDEQIPSDRQHLLSPRLKRKLASLKKHDAFSKNESIELKISILKKNLEDAASEWETLSTEQQNLQKKKANLEAQQLKLQIDELKSLQNSHRNANLELDLIRYGDSKLLKEYEDVRRCLEYEY